MSLRRPAHSCFTCQNRHRSEWCTLDDDEMTLLDRMKTCNEYKAGQVIFYQGNPCLGIYCVEEGTVGVKRTDDQGNAMLSRLVHAGQTLGYRTYFSGNSYTATAEAITNTRVCFIDKSGVAQLLAKNPTLGQQFLGRLARDLESAEVAHMQTITLPVRARLAHLLLVMKDRFGTVDDDGVLEVQLPLARQDLASILGTRPETIARAIRDLQNDGIADFEGRKVRIDDLDRLMDETELLGDV